MKSKISKATVSFLIAAALIAPVVSGLVSAFPSDFEVAAAQAQSGALDYIDYDENEIVVTEDYSAIVGAATATTGGGGYYNNNRRTLQLGAMKRQLDDGKSGLLLSAVETGDDAEGATVQFTNRLFDDFSMDFRVFSQEAYEGFFVTNASDPTDDRYNPFLDLKEVGIKITSASDPTKAFTIDVHGASSWTVPTVCVSAYVEGEKFTSGSYRGYGLMDSGAQRANYATQLNGTSFVNVSPNELNECTSVSVDMQTLKVYGVSRDVELISRTPIVTEKKKLVRDLVTNLNEENVAVTGALLTLSPEDFKDGYYVSVEFNDVTSNDTEVRKTNYDGLGDGFFSTCNTVPLRENEETMYERKANMIVYSINGQSLAKHSGFVVDEQTDVSGTAVDKDGQGGEAWKGDVLRLHTQESGLKAEGTAFDYAGVKTGVFEQEFAVYTWSTNRALYSAATPRYNGGNGLEDDQNPQPTVKQVAFDFVSVSNPEAKFTLYVRSNGTSGSMIIPEARVEIPQDRVYTHNFEKGYGLKSDDGSFTAATQTQIDGGFKGTSINGNYNVAKIKFDAAEMKVYGVSGGNYVLIRDLVNNSGTSVPVEYCASLSTEDFAEGYTVSFRVCDVTRDGLGGWENRNPADVANDLYSGRVYNNNGKLTANPNYSYEFDAEAYPTRTPDIWFAGLTTDGIDGLNTSASAEYDRELPVVKTATLLKGIAGDVAPVFGGLMSTGATATGTISYANGEHVGTIAPNDDGEYIFTPTRYGTYTFVIPTSWNGKTVNREVQARVLDVTAPTIALKNGLQKVWIYAENEQKPVISDSDVEFADDSGECTLSVEVLLNKKAIAVEKAFEAEGVYEIVYTASDEFGNVASVSRRFTVYAADTDAPVISVAGGARNVKVGSVVEIPAYTCNDNEGGSLTAAVKVLFNGEEIAVQDGKFTAEKAGEYKLVFTATDDSGNVGMTTVIVTAAAVEEQGGCASSVALGSSMAVIVLLAACVLLRKQRMDKSKCNNGLND